MKKINFICVLIPLLVSGTIMAQSKDSVPARRVVEKGTRGDIILGKENKKKELNTTPQGLKDGDSVHKKVTYALPKKKKCNAKRKSVE